MKSLSIARRCTGIAAGLASIAAVFAISVIAERTQRQQAAGAEAPTSSVASVSFNERGELLRPEGYRKWVYVGTPLTPNDMNDGKAPFPEFHSVYVDPESFAHFEMTGEFQDGTVVIKELVGVGTKRASSGRGYFMGEFTGLEVAIKDKTRFKDQPGNWAYFSFGHEYPLAESASVQPVANCSVCHGANADTDYVFTQYYPVLRATLRSEPVSN